MYLKLRNGIKDRDELDHPSCKVPANEAQKVDFHLSEYNTPTAVTNKDTQTVISAASDKVSESEKEEEV